MRERMCKKCVRTYVVCLALLPDSVRILSDALTYCVLACAMHRTEHSITAVRWFVFRTFDHYGCVVLYTYFEQIILYIARKSVSRTAAIPINFLPHPITHRTHYTIRLEFFYCALWIDETLLEYEEEAILVIRPGKQQRTHTSSNIDNKIVSNSGERIDFSKINHTVLYIYRFATSLWRRNVSLRNDFHTIVFIIFVHVKLLNRILYDLQHCSLFSRNAESRFVASSTNTA